VLAGQGKKERGEKKNILEENLANSFQTNKKLD
jgi:hypothetical protein